MALPLQGVRVLDIASILAGPYGATMLADMGADVIKIEPPRGDECRYFQPRTGMDSAMYVSLNRNKRGLVLDLAQPAGLEAYVRLLKTADIVVENLRPAAKTRLGIDYEASRAHQPKIIYISVSTFGQTGPYAHRPGIDPVAQAISGFMAVTGERGGEPLKAGPAVADATCAMLVAYAAMLGLWVRERQGIGQQIEVCLLDGLIHLQAPYVGRYLLFDEIVPRVGNSSVDYAPYGSFRCRDGRLIQIAVFNQKFWLNFCRALAHDELTHDPRFSTNDGRLAHRVELEAMVQRILLELDASDWLRRLEAADVIAGPVYTYRETFQDPQVLHNQMLAEVEHAALGRIKVHGLPVKLTQTPGEVRQAAPTLGQHSEAILREVGYAIEEIHEFMAKGITAAGSAERQPGHGVHRPSP
jgi:crotonobetainyl-CoA:carnitine CoA-transferase CaiB-like acyl-CoA transferase